MILQMRFDILNKICNCKKFKNQKLKKVDNYLNTFPIWVDINN
jgi:hypothetical protein